MHWKSSCSAQYARPDKHMLFPVCFQVLSRFTSEENHWQWQLEIWSNQDRSTYVVRKPHSSSWEREERDLLGLGWLTEPVSCWLEIRARTKNGLEHVVQLSEYQIHVHTQAHKHTHIHSLSLLLTIVELTVALLTIDDIEAIWDACLHVADFKVKPLSMLWTVCIRIQYKVIFISIHEEKRGKREKRGGKYNLNFCVVQEWTLLCILL